MGRSPGGGQTVPIATPVVDMQNAGQPDQLPVVWEYSCGKNDDRYMAFAKTEQLQLEQQ